MLARCLAAPALLAAFLVIAARPAIAQPANPAKATPPNVLIILCDDLGYGDLACFGHPQIRTPNLDKLAAGGLKLTRFYAAAPVCSASRVGLLTGRTPTRQSVYDWIPGGHPMHMDRSELTIAALLKRAGYATGHFGKWHCNGAFNLPDQQPQPNDHGFDYWFSTQNNASPSHRNPNNFVRNGQPVGPLEGYSCQLVADEAIAWIRQRRGGASAAVKGGAAGTRAVGAADGGGAASAAPFFAHVCFHEPHEPVASPEDLVESYLQAGVTPRERAEYFANVTNMDRAVGRLLAALDELNLRDNTLVIFNSDNGPETLKRYPAGTRSYGTPGDLRGMKLWVYEGGIRVPGIMSWPGHTRPGSVSDEAVCSLDFLPTLCKLAGVALPTDRVYDGADFTPVLDGRPILRTTPLFWHYYAAIGEPRVAMIMGRDKIVAQWDQGKLGPIQQMSPEDWQKVKAAKLTDYELYNLDADPLEQRDLAPEQPQKLASMAEALQAKYADVMSTTRPWPAGPKANPNRQKQRKTTTN